MLEILTISIAHQNHLLQQFTVGRHFRHNLPIDQKQLLDRMILQWQHESDDGHEKTRQSFSIQKQLDDFLQRVNLHADLALLC